MWGYMILRKNISLNEEYLQKLEPLIEKHNGNLSAVIREVIDLADAAFQDPDSVKRLISGLKKEQSLTSLALAWALRNLAGRIPDEEIVHNIVGNNIYSISALEERLNELAGEIYWGSSTKIISDDDRQPKNVTCTITGKNPDMNRFLGAVIAIFAAKKYALGIYSLRSVNDTFEIIMKSSEDGIKSIEENFGYMDPAFRELYKKPDFWNIIIPLHAKMNYNMVTISRQLFDEVLGGMANPKISACFENFFGCPIHNITLEEFLKKMQVLYKSMGLIEDMNINKDSLIIHHGLNNPDAIKKLADMFVELLNLSGQTYTSTVGENLIVLKPLPAVGKILIKIIEDFKPVEEPIENHHKDIIRMLDMLKNVPSNEEFIKSLGRKFGKRMIQTYEKDKKIDKWDAQSFIKCMQDMSVIFNQESKWEIVSENVIYGKISTCPLIKGEEKINSMNCTFIKGIFDEWISHVFGEQVERVHAMPTAFDFCEAYVAFDRINRNWQDKKLAP